MALLFSGTAPAGARGGYGREFLPDRQSCGACSDSVPALAVGSGLSKFWSVVPEPLKAIDTLLCFCVKDICFLEKKEKLVFAVDFTAVA